MGKKFKFYQIEHSDMFGPPSNEDFALIKEFLKSEDIIQDCIFVYPVKLCDSLPDRDGECFAAKALESVKTLVVGKPGIKNHDWTSDNIHSRIYKAEIEVQEDCTCVVGYAYTVVTGSTESLIQDIKSGLLNEVSLGFSAVSYTKLDTGIQQIDDVNDVYEWSFVAVPAQPKAGVVKGLEQNENDKGVKTMDFEVKCKELEADIATKSLKLKELEEDLEKKSVRIKELEDAVIDSAIASAVAEVLTGLVPKGDKAAEIADRVAREGISVDDNGDIQGIAEAKACLKSDYPFLFEDEKPDEEEKSEEEPKSEDAKEEETEVKSKAFIVDNIVKKQAKKPDFTYIPNK